MSRYSQERKESVLKKMQPPHNIPIPQLAKEENISQGTLYSWRDQARRSGLLIPDADTTPEGWTSRDKFAAVLETAALNEIELAEYCRKKGLFPEQIQRWRQACETANDIYAAQESDLKQQLKQEKKKIKKVERELARKEKALAEAAALLVLKKKAEIFYGEHEED